MKYTLKYLAEHVDGYVVGDENCEVERVATLKNANAGDISFLTNLKYKDELQTTNASAVIVNEQHAYESNTNYIVVSNPHPAYAIIANILYQKDFSQQCGVHSAATVDPDSAIDKTAWIGPGCVIEAGVKIGSYARINAGSYIGENSIIGDNCTVYPNVTIMNDSVVGDRVIIHPGVVIGADGFGQAFDGEKWIKVPQIGCVQIGNDVEIGANTTIDRGTIENTIIHDGVKLDNLIQIAHNVTIGKHTVMAACCAIAGSTNIGQNCAIGGCVGIVGHIKIVDNVTITARSTVLQSIKQPGVYSSSTPLETNSKWHKNHIRFKQLDEMARRIKLIEKEIKMLRG